MIHALKGILLFLSLLSFFQLFAQNQQKADSILFVLKSKSLTQRQTMEAYYWLSTTSTSPIDELKYAEILLDLAKIEGDAEYIIKANQRIGVAKRLHGDLAESLIYLFESANQALENKSFEPILADIYSEISTCYTQNGDSENALLYGKKTLDILQKTDRIQEYAIGLMNLGYDYYTIGEYDSAIAYYKRSNPIFQSLEMPIGEAYVLGNSALVDWKTGQVDIAKMNLLKAIEKLKPLGDNYGMADYYNNLATIYWEESNPAEAIIYATKGLELAQQEGMKEQIRDASYLLFSAYKNTAQFEKALKYQSLYFEKKDSIQNLESTLEIANLRTLFEVGKKQSEVDLLLEQRKNTRSIMLAGAIAIFIMIVLLCIIYFYSKTKIKLNEELEERKNKLLELNNTKDKFFSVISHDLRGPVGIIDGYVSVFRRKFDDISTEELKIILDQM
ncbi:MAG: tetratricopeptide repeat protein, partial [Cyclobacteriaceae bacterium]